MKRLQASFGRGVGVARKSCFFFSFFFFLLFFPSSNTTIICSRHFIEQTVIPCIVFAGQLDVQNGAVSFRAFPEIRRRRRQLISIGERHAV